MTTYTGAGSAVATRRISLNLEISIPWRLLAMGISLFGGADIVGMEGSSGAATGMFFGSYALLAASLTMFISRSGR